MVISVPEIPAVWLRRDGKYCEISVSRTSYPQSFFQLTKEELAAQKAEELKNKIERGLPDKDEDDEVKEVGTKSRFDLLDEE